MAIVQVSGKVVFLRTHELGTGYGAGNDFLDDEVIVSLDSTQGSAYGFKLREDEALPAHEGMLNVLTAAMRNNWSVTLDVDELPGRHNHELLRVAVQR